MCLVVAGQRPANLNYTVISPCNLIAMQQTKGERIEVIRRLLPNCLSGFGGLLQVLDTGEALVIDERLCFPTRIPIREPVNEPLSHTRANLGPPAHPGDAARIDKAVDGWGRHTFIRWQVSCG